MLRQLTEQWCLLFKNTLREMGLTVHATQEMFRGMSFTVYHHHHYHLSLNREGRWGTTDDFATSFLHLSLFSTVLCDLANSKPVHPLMSSYLFFCLPCLLPPFTVPYKMVLTRPDEREI